jgi:hypothetical protein
MANPQYFPRLSYMRTVALAIASLASPPCAHAANFSAPDTALNSIETRSVDMALPNTPQELWKRIVISLQKNGGFTPRKDVEEILGIRFTYTEKDGEKQALGAKSFHSFKDDMPGIGFLSIGLYDDPTNTSLSISWGPEYREMKGCLDLSDITQDLKLLNWMPGGRSVNPGRGNQPFYKTEDWLENSRSGKPLDVFTGTAKLTLFMPNQFSKCVNAVTTHVWRR